MSHKKRRPPAGGFAARTSDADLESALRAVWAGVSAGGDWHGPVATAQQRAQEPAAQV